MKIEDIARIVNAGGVVDLTRAGALPTEDLRRIAAATNGRGGLIFRAGAHTAAEIITVVSAAPGRVQVQVP